MFSEQNPHDHVQYPELRVFLGLEESSKEFQKHLSYQEAISNPEVQKIQYKGYVIFQDLGWRIAENFKAGENLNMGFGCIIEGGVEIGNNANIGHNCTIEKDTIVQNDLTLGDEVHLAPGTRLANNVNFARRVVTTGICYVGENSRIRAGSTLSRAWIVEPLVFMGAGIMTSHTQHVDLGRSQMPQEQFLSRVGYGAIVGSGVQAGAGVEIGPGTIVGYNSFIPPGSQLESYGVYFNSPEPKASLQYHLRQGNPWYIEVSEDYQPHYFTSEMLGKYLPGYTIPDWLDQLEAIGKEVMPGVLAPPAGWQQPEPLNKKA